MAGKIKWKHSNIPSIEARNTVHRTYARWESLLLLPSFLPSVRDNGNGGDTVGDRREKEK